MAFATAVGIIAVGIIMVSLQQKYADSGRSVAETSHPVPAATQSHPQLPKRQSRAESCA